MFNDLSLDKLSNEADVTDLASVVGEDLLMEILGVLKNHKNEETWPRFQRVIEGTSIFVQETIGHWDDPCVQIYATYGAAVSIVESYEPNHPRLAEMKARGEDFYAQIVAPAVGLVERDDDYAPGVTGLYERLIAGAKVDPPISGAKFRAFMLDVEVFSIRLGRHEFTVEQAETLIEALSKNNKLRDLLIESMKGIQRSLVRMTAGASHLVALEMQWEAYRANSYLIKTGAASRSETALQESTISSLRTASTFCWSSSVVEAVASAADRLPPDAFMTPTALGEFARYGSSGFWWFEEPIPIKTTNLSGEEEPVCALLWRREAPVTRRFDFLAPPSKARVVELPRICFQTMILAPMKTGPGAVPRVVPTPTMSTLVPDGIALQDMRRFLEDGYKELMVESRKDPELRSGTLEEVIDAAVWFFRFYLAASTWLRQRVVSIERGEGVRQVARRIQRENKLAETPKVTVVELRRRDVATRNQTPTEGEKRNFSCRFVVHGHFRNQWYPTRQEHAPKWIESYVKGPDDKPLRTTTRVFAVRR